MSDCSDNPDGADDEKNQRLRVCCGHQGVGSVKVMPEMYEL